MQVYVIAPSADGPSKIGVATFPVRRLRGLQTGSSVRLELHHVEPIGTAAKAIECCVHDALCDKRSGGGNEWFEVSPTEVIPLIKETAMRAGVLVDDEIKKLGDLERASVMRWLRERADKDDGELGDISPPTITRLLAINIPSPPSGRFTFNDYLLTWHEGMWLRWAFERLGRRMPSGRSLKPYVEADNFLEREGAKYGREIDFRWMEWSAGRDLRPEEARTLATIWDKFVLFYNDLFSYGSQYPAYGTDDHVDDVHVFCLKRDEGRGDKECVVFFHKEFRAVLVPSKNVKLDRSISGELCPLGNVAVSGFVAPPIPSDIWDKPIKQWLRSARPRCDSALARFLNNPTKRYPGRRPYDGILAARARARVRVPLDCIEEDGGF